MAARKKAKKTSRQKAASPLFSAWRYYAPASLCGPDGGAALPLSLLPAVLKALKCEKAADFMKEIKRHERHKIPARLQARVRRLFAVDGCDSRAMRQLAFRDLDLSWGGRVRAVSYPFKVAGEVRVGPFSVSAFRLEVDRKKGTFSVYGRYGVSTNGFLAPRAKKAQVLCELVCGGLLGTSELSQEDAASLAEWLVLSGFSKAQARQAVLDEGFCFDLASQICERIELMVGLSGVEALHIDGEPLVLEGEEERGFSRV
jgi:hypothetical protein